MSKLDARDIGRLLRPYLDADAPAALCEQVQRYLALLETWNRKLNLTSVRDPEQMVQRHFGESFLLSQRLSRFDNLLDVGSGAGFPGLPISLQHPEAKVLLAESQTRKAVFLREAAWTSGSSAQVWPHRVEELEPSRRFDVVTLRAVDNMQSALSAAVARVKPGGLLAVFTGESSLHIPDADWTEDRTYDVPLSTGHIRLLSLASSA